ncbi:hypothetical protein G6F50_014550 [Rhizopus delemar]|uniref:Uncharacterized protein n=1 Tax=Rhizopus delemar TaxID=936053 RepID=A0A9P7C7E5_9FUNG|nr:hypothetical protein G6F50_014550 [Rhizopus delemar]
MRCTPSSSARWASDERRRPAPVIHRRQRHRRTRHLGARIAHRFWRPRGPRQSGLDRLPGRNPGAGGRIGYGQDGAAAPDHRPGPARGRHREGAGAFAVRAVARRTQAPVLSLGHAVPGGGAVLGAVGVRQCGPAAARAAHGAGRPGTRRRHVPAGDGGPVGAGRRQAAVGPVRRHGQARGAGACAVAGPRTGVPGRAHRRPGPVAVGRIRGPGAQPAPAVGIYRRHGDARSGHAAGY